MKISISPDFFGTVFFLYLSMKHYLAQDLPAQDSAEDSAEDSTIVKRRPNY